MRQFNVDIIAGTLAMTLRKEVIALEDLLGFASRENPKRGYLFVSKVLGKHIPCRPSTMRAIHDALARQILPTSAAVIVLGMAETAVALGGGVAHSLSRLNPALEVVYGQTTRHRLAQTVAFTLDENHSHAPDHIVYQFSDGLQHTASLATHCVIVDDEISTGRTLQLLSQRLHQYYPQLQKITWVSIANWLSESQEQAHQAQLRRIEIDFVSLLDGHFHFQQRADFNPTLPNTVDANLAPPCLAVRSDTGRTGLSMSHLTFDMQPKFCAQNSVVVVGQGEFTLQPFLWAEALEQRGIDVLFQSTTRSPILVGDAIVDKIEFNNTTLSNASQFIYNLPTDRDIVYTYETAEQAESCGLRKQRPGHATVWG